jgi:hypothetical protein
VGPYGDTKEDFKVIKLLLFEQTSQWLGVHRETFQGMEVTTFHLKNASHMLDRLAMVPEENKGNSTRIHGDIF